MLRSRYPDIQIPDVPVHQFLFRHLKDRANQTIWVETETGKSYNYKETWKISNQISSMLHNRGLKKGDVMAVYLHNCPEFAFMVYGCMALGVIVTTISTAFTKEEVRRQLLDSDATYIFTDEELAPNAKYAAEHLGIIKEIFCKGRSPGCSSYDEFLSYSGPAFVWNSVKFNTRDDIVLRPYSSGTTGVPKGVNLTHRGLINGVLVGFNDIFMPKSNGPGQPEKVIGLLPFYHMSGMYIYIFGGFANYDITYTMKKFIPEAFVKNIEKYKISVLVLVPPLVVFLNKSPVARKSNLSTVHRVSAGAAAISKETELEFLQLHPSVKCFIQLWGMTELSPIATGVPYSKPKTGSIGVVIPNTEIKIIDPVDGSLKGPKQTGELCVRGPQVMKGYHNKPEETRKTIDEQGFLHTGDLGYYDEEGYLFFVERIKELIKVKGLQVSPAELEGVILEHPEVADVGITSVPDERAGELPFAFIVRKPGSKLAGQSLQSYLAERVADYKRPKGGVKFVDEIPKSQSGKIQRIELKKIANAIRKSKL